MANKTRIIQASVDPGTSTEVTFTGKGVLRAAIFAKNDTVFDGSDRCEVFVDGEGTATFVLKPSGSLDFKFWKSGVVGGRKIINHADGTAPSNVYVEVGAIFDTSVKIKTFGTDSIGRSVLGMITEL